MSECFLGQRKNVPKISTPVHARVFELMLQVAEEETFSGIRTSVFPPLGPLVILPTYR
jgi:hypothetical protein